MFEIQNLSFSYGKSEVIKNLSLEFLDGEFVSILGGNGVGKSSLIKLMSGALSPNNGNIFFNQKNLKLYSPLALAKNRAVLEQEISLAFNYKVIDVVLLGRFASENISSPKLDLSYAKKSLEDVDLKGFEYRNYYELSGGEKRRVQLARVLCQLSRKDSSMQNTLLLLDEPSSGLDPYHSLLSLKLAKNLTKLGAIVVAVLHDVNLATQFSDKILLLGTAENKCQKLFFGNVENFLNKDLISSAFKTHCDILTFNNKKFIHFS